MLINFVIQKDKGIHINEWTKKVYVKWAEYEITLFSLLYEINIIITNPLFMIEETIYIYMCIYI